MPKTKLPDRGQIDEQEKHFAAFLQHMIRGEHAALAETLDPEVRWHLPPFSRAVQGAVPKGGSEHEWNGNGRLNGSKDHDAEVDAALRDVFRAKDLS